MILSVCCLTHRHTGTQIHTNPHPHSHKHANTHHCSLPYSIPCLSLCCCCAPFRWLTKTVCLFTRWSLCKSLPFPACLLVIPVRPSGGLTKTVCLFTRWSLFNHCLSLLVVCCFCGPFGTVDKDSLPSHTLVFPQVTAFTSSSYSYTSICCNIKWAEALIRSNLHIFCTSCRPAISKELNCFDTPNPQLLQFSAILILAEEPMVFEDKSGSDKSGMESTTSGTRSVSDIDSHTLSTLVLLRQIQVSSYWIRERKKKKEIVNAKGGEREREREREREGGGERERESVYVCVYVCVCACVYLCVYVCVTAGSHLGQQHAPHLLRPRISFFFFTLPSCNASYDSSGSCEVLYVTRKLRSASVIIIMERYCPDVYVWPCRSGFGTQQHGKWCRTFVRCVPLLIWLPVC